MNISISNIAWKNEEEASIASFLEEQGIQGVDVAYTKFWPSPSDASPDALKEYRAFWAAHGIKIVGMQSLIYGRPDLMLFGDPAVRDEMRQYLSAVFQLAAELGAGPLVFGSPKNRLKGDLSDAAAIESACEFFGQLAQEAAAKNVVLCIEPNPPEYGCDFIQTTASALELVKRVNHPHFCLHLDAAIMTMTGEDIEANLEAAMESLAHVHISEPQLGVVGEGSVDHPRFAAALRRLGYQGWVAIEMRSGWRPVDLDSVRIALNYAQEVYNG